MTSVAELQDLGHLEGHDYEAGSPHLTHPQLRLEVIRRLQALVAEAFARGRRPRVLEVGAGHGSFTDHLLAFGAEVTATEMSRASANFLRTRYAGNPAATVILDADGSAPGRLGETFDLVVAASVLHHIPDYLGAVSSWTSVIAPGGAFFSVEDPLRYDRVSPVAHRAQRLSHYAWTLTRPGAAARIGNRIRRARRGFDDSRASDMVEYHVLRDGNDEVALTAQLETAFDTVELWRYWSTPSGLLQSAGERAGLVTNFSITARGRR